MNCSLAILNIYNWSYCHDYVKSHLSLNNNSLHLVFLSLKFFVDIPVISCELLNFGYIIFSRTLIIMPSL
jgi:hypothetical protein